MKSLQHTEIASNYSVNSGAQLCCALLSAGYACTCSYPVFKKSRFKKGVW